MGHMECGHPAVKSPCRAGALPSPSKNMQCRLLDWRAQGQDADSMRKLLKGSSENPKASLWISDRGQSTQA
jgi:hypothetical protein